MATPQTNLDSSPLAPYPQHLDPTGRLPPEVLSLIFSTALLDNPPYTEYHEPISIYFTYFGTIDDCTLMALTQICRFWREVALGTPSLWRNILILGSTKLEMVDTWIKRSKSVPLEICVDFGRTCTVEHASRVATLLSPHIERWRMLCWECTLGLEAIFDAMRGKETPLLEVLSLDDRACRGVEYDEQLSNPFAVASSAPKLTVVEFRTIATITNFWADHPFRNLTSLEIATVDTKPTLDQLLDLLRACPMLEALGIRYEYSEAEGDQPSAPQMASRIPLLALKSLSLRDFNTPNSVNTLLSFIHAPNLSYLDLLDLYCDTPDEDPDFSEIFRFLKDTAEAFGDFLNVQAMRLGGIACKCTSPFLHMFLWRFTNLRKLHLVEHDEDDPSFAKSLLDFVGHSRSFFPRLEVLKTSGIKGRVLMTVAKRRMRIGAPLKTVIYHEDDEEKIRTWKARLQALGVVVESCDDEPIHAE